MEKYVSYERQRQLRRRGSIRWIAILAVLAASSLVLYLIFYRGSSVEAPSQDMVSTEESEKPETPSPAVSPQEPAVNLQPVVESWAKKTGGTYSVVVEDLKNEKVIASLNADTEYFAASIYKIYVAYIGYLKVDDGTYKLSEPYLNGWTRGKCLDEMIKTSHSPCAEKMWVELGKENLSAQLKKYGLKNTSMTGLTTTAGDVAIILSRLEQRRDLSEESRAALLGSMRKQIYRDALPKGFLTAEVYNKVGFRELVEYHDTAIVRFTNNRNFVVSVLTKNVGTKNIAGLAREIEKALK